MNAEPSSPAGLSRLRTLLDAARRRASLISAVMIVALICFLGSRTIAPKHGLNGRYYPNDRWAGSPVFAGLDPIIAFSNEILTAKAGHAGTSSADWEGYLFAPKDGAYRFSISSDDGSWVYVDETLVVDNGGVHPNRRAEGDVALTKGRHRLRLKYFNGGGDGSLEFEGRRIVSAKRLGPRLSLYPKEVRSGLVLFDSALSILGSIAIVICVLAGLVLLLLAPRPIIAFFSKGRALWIKGRDRWSVFLSAGPKRIGSSRRSAPAFSS